MKFIVRIKGGKGSGHHGHAGRPGSVGGSVGGSIAMSVRTGRAAAIRRGWKPPNDFKGWTQKVRGVLDVAKKAVSKVSKRSKFSGNVAAYGRHRQPAIDALRKVKEQFDEKSSGLTGFDLDEWQSLGKALDRLQRTLDTKSGK